jgi:hypothetical protein
MLVAVGHQRPISALTRGQRGPQPRLNEAHHACRIALTNLHAGKNRDSGIGINPRGRAEIHHRECKRNHQTTATAHIASIGPHRP